MEEIREVAYCPRCGNRAPQKLIHSQFTSDIGWYTDGEAAGEQTDIPVSYCVASCETCYTILLYRAIGDFVDGKGFTQAELVWPHSGKLHKSVPVSVTTIYDEALRIKTLAPNAFAVQIRRALEALCSDRGAKRAALQGMLKELADRGEIPSTLAEVTDVLRLLGNVGAHAASESVKPWQVYAMDEFFRAVVEYVYVAPSKLKEFKDSLKALKSKEAGAAGGDV
jgi:hypothetical protein